MPIPPVLWDIESGPALADTKMIAEAWDAAGSIRSATSRETVGRSGTIAFATISATSSGRE
jgi:hypothetical protein